MKLLQRQNRLSRLQKGLQNLHRRHHRRRCLLFLLYLC
jgi:hypothetical protein